MVKALHAGNRAKHVEFSNAILQDMKDDNFLICLIFTDEAKFYISDKVNCCNVQIWELKNPQDFRTLP